MSTKWIIGIMILHIVFSILSGMHEMASPLAVGEVARIKVLMTPTVFSIFSWDYISNLWGIFWFDYSFFTGGWIYVRFLCMCTSIGVIVSLVLAIVRGVSSN